MRYCKWTFPLGLLSLCLLTSCASTQFEMGTVQYYRVAPQIPSHVVNPEERKKYLFEPYVQIWGMLGTVNEDGPKLTPQEIVLGGRHYPISNLKTSNRNHEFYYLFEVKDQDAIKRLPVDLMTGNLTAVDEGQRHRSPIKIVFAKHEDRSTWVRVGTIEQSTIPTRDAVMSKFEAP
jgi:hypothetical protein